MSYIGRFAPSPTGPLHFGSLIAALGSWLDARANNGQWLLRIEDLDPPREMAGASELIIQSLEKHGLFWDGEISYQSQRLSDYDNLLEQLKKSNKTYQCHCSRREIREQGGQHIRCVNKVPKDPNFSHRLIVDNNESQFDDYYHGLIQTDETQANEDFILKRKDGLHAYMLAVVADDIAQGITHIIRGADLLSTTSQQIYLFKTLHSQVPKFGHLPLATRNNGDKLSKQNHAPAITDDNAKHNLWEALIFLGQEIPADIMDMTIQEILDSATNNWQPELFKGKQSATVQQEYSH